MAPTKLVLTKTIKLRISNLCADHVPIVRFRTGRFFLRVTADDGEGDSTCVAIANAGAVAWDRDLHIDAAPGSMLHFALVATHRRREDTIEGWYDETIDPSIRNPGPLRRAVVDQHGALATHIKYRIELLPSDAPCAQARRPAAPYAKMPSADVGVAGGLRSAMRAGVVPVLLNSGSRKDEEPRDDLLDVGTVEDLSESFDTLLKYADSFAKVVGKFSEINPYAKMAYSVLTMAHTVAVEQKERDKNLRELIVVASDVFLFVKDLKDLDKHERTIRCLMLQTTECAYFIRDYTKQKSFVVRAGTGVFSGSAMNEKIAEYKKKFRELKQAFLDEAALQTDLIVLRIAEQIDRIAANSQLDDLPYGFGARFDLGKQCITGTREAALEHIFAWANDSSSDKPRVLILSGAPGTGKSAIAHTIARRFDELRRLGSSFFFSGGNPQRSADKLFSTITRDLADLESGWRDALTRVLPQRALRRTGCIRQQWEEFILKPAGDPSSVYFGPVIIVIDGLDTVQDQEARDSLISILSSRTRELPHNFRILITTRPDTDIRNAFEAQEDVAWCTMDQLVDSKSNLKDIEEFLDHELDNRPGLKWNDKICHKLSRKSEGDFPWAAFACTFIKHLDGSLGPSDRLSRLLLHPKGTPVSLLEAQPDPASESECELAGQSKYAFYRIPARWVMPEPDHGHISGDH
ncbi:hypothetical protein FB45DRAFT_911424 [Roridomyces roridus]|uniref:NACHT domain-containing protein n=1 Tax=Roridomyces roridus TaxID=1738132 RepID=A0AAD7C054_9AGAR|nr:hypothetical protein FB45DRAFT_911424 [Roridomyces roridus]